jgi:thiamine-phosphate pyrophosphorylase
VRCRLYLSLPPEVSTGALELESFVPSLDDAMSGGDVASVLLPTTGADEAVLRRSIDRLRPMVQERDAAFLLEGRADLALETDCDGVHLPASPGALKAVRQALGKDMILGADCEASRHLAMLAGEIGADYVMLDARDPDLVAWWAELMEVPCVAQGGVDLDTAPELIAAGADFLSPDSAIWTHPDGPRKAVAAFNALMAEA